MTFKNRIMSALKKIKFIIIVLLLGFQTSTIAQSWFYFEGIITDVDSLTPLADFPVYIQTNDTNCRVAFTDNNGYYIDSVFANHQTFNYAVVSVNDCFGEIIYHYFEPPEEYNVAGFSVCYMPNICQAYFYYLQVPDNPLLINFFEMSEGILINGLGILGMIMFLTNKTPATNMMRRVFIRLF